MGTSTKWRGPVKGGWTGAAGSVTRALNDLIKGTGSSNGGAVGGLPSASNLDNQTVESLGEKHLDALFDELVKDSTTYGLARATNRAALVLIDILAKLDAAGLAPLGSIHGATAQDRQDWFVCTMIDQVTSAPGSIADAAVRRASRRTAEELLRKSPELRRRLDDGESGGPLHISRELFCLLYAHFFADAVAEFLRSVIAAKLKLTFPAIVLVDPTDRVVNWVSGKLVELVPTPCEESDAAEMVELFEVGHQLVTQTLPRVAARYAGGELS